MIYFISYFFFFYYCCYFLLETAGTTPSIPVTVRQLEAIIRITESLAKMQLNPVANKRHVEEAIRLFKVATVEAASSGNLRKLFYDFYNTIIMVLVCYYYELLFVIIMVLLWY